MIQFLNNHIIYENNAPWKSIFVRNVRFNVLLLLLEQIKNSKYPAYQI